MNLVKILSVMAVTLTLQGGESAQGAKLTVTCEMSEVEEGGVHVTCNYPKGILQTGGRLSLSVSTISLHDDSDTKILQCEWDGTLHCSIVAPTISTYRVKGDHQLEVTITEGQVGKLLCQALTTSGLEIKPKSCLLPNGTNRSDHTKPTSTSQPTTTSQPTITNQPNGTNNGSVSDSPLRAGAIAGISVGAVVILAVIVAVVVIVYRRRKKKRTGKKRDAPNSGGALDDLEAGGVQMEPLLHANGPSGGPEAESETQEPTSVKKEIERLNSSSGRPVFPSPGNAAQPGSSSNLVKGSDNGKQKRRTEETGAGHAKDHPSSAQTEDATSRPPAPESFGNAMESGSSKDTVQGFDNENEGTGTEETGAGHKADSVSSVQAEGTTARPPVPPKPRKNAERMDINYSSRGSDKEDEGTRTKTDPPLPEKVEGAAKGPPEEKVDEDQEEQDKDQNEDNWKEDDELEIDQKENDQKENDQKTDHKDDQKEDPGDEELKEPLLGSSVDPGSTASAH